MKWRFRYYSGLAVVFLFIVISVGFSGCGSSAGKKYYQLSLAPVAAGPGFIDKSVMIGPVVVEDIYNDYRVVYRTSRYQLNFYSYHFWIKKPDKMVRDVIGDYFRDGGVFREVVSGLARGEPDLVLSVGVRVMEEFDSPGAWFAHLRMDIRVEEYK
ncbi:MAG: hypothetical protein GY940_07710, partial [bacterium]|nr:hypothetical protein [bacterium]